MYQTTMAVQINSEDDQNLYLDLVPLLPNEGWINHPSYPFSQAQPTFIVEGSPSAVLPAQPTYLTSINPSLVFHHLANPINSIPSVPALPTIGMISGPDDIAHVLRNHHRDVVRPTDDVPSPQRDDTPESTFLRNHHRDVVRPTDDVPSPQRDDTPESTFLVSVDDLVPNRSQFLNQSPQRDNLPELQPAILVPVDDLVRSESQAGREFRRDILQETPQLRFRRLIEASRSNATTGMGARTGSHHPDTNPDTLMSNILALEAARREKLKNGKASSEKKNDDRCQFCADFECNICFETSVEPVVTQCGHLFCWRCLYKWISMQLLGISECPICKGEVTESTLTPIYGRGGSSAAPDPVPGEVVEEIPPRPSGRRTDSTRQIIRREREVNGRAFGTQDVQRVRTDLEAVLARLRQLPRPNRTTAPDVDAASAFARPNRTTATDSDAAEAFARPNRTIATDSDAAETFAGTMRRVVPFPRVFEGEDVIEVGGRGEVRGVGDGPEDEQRSSVAGEMHVRRRRRYR